MLILWLILKVILIKVYFLFCIIMNIFYNRLEIDDEEFERIDLIIYNSSSDSN